MRTLFILLLLQVATCLKSQQFPDFQLVAINGDTLSNEYFKNRLVYINVFETYCNPCIEEIPVLDSLMKKHPDVLFVAITPASREKTILFLKKHPIYFTVLPEAQKLCNRLYANIYPSHIIIDKSGNCHNYSIFGTICKDDASEEANEDAFRQQVYARFDKLLSEYENK